MPAFVPKIRIARVCRYLRQLLEFLCWETWTILRDYKKIFIEMKSATVTSTSRNKKWHEVHFLAKCPTDFRGPPNIISVVLLGVSITIARSDHVAAQSGANAEQFRDLCVRRLLPGGIVLNLPNGFIACTN